MATNKLAVIINGKEYVSKEALKASASIKDLGQTTKKVSDAMGKAFLVASASIIAATTALVATAVSSAATADRIDKLSQKLGLSSKAFQEWDYILSQSGVSIDSLQTSIKTLSVAAVEASKGNKKFGASFEKLGVSVTDGYGKIKSQEVLLEETILALSAMGNETERTALATELLGKSATELAPLFNSGANSITAMRNRANELGLVLSENTILAGVKLTDTIDQLKRKMTATVVQAMTPLMSELSNIGQSFLDMSTGDGPIARFAGVLVRTVAWAVDKIPYLGAAFGFIGDVLVITYDEIVSFFDKAKLKVDGIFANMFPGSALVADIKLKIGETPPMPTLPEMALNVLLKMAGKVYDSIKKGINTGDWKDFWPAINITGTSVLAITATLGLVAGEAAALYKTIQAALVAVAGFAMPKATGIALLTIGFMAVSAMVDGDWTAVGKKLSVGLAAGLLAFGITESATVGLFVFSIAANLDITKLTENLPDPAETAQKVKDWVSGWWTLVEKDWETYGKKAGEAFLSHLGTALQLITTGVVVGLLLEDGAAALFKLALGKSMLSAGFLSPKAGAIAGTLAAMSIMLMVTNGMADGDWTTVVEKLTAGLTSALLTFGITKSPTASFYVFTIMASLDLHNVYQGIHGVSKDFKTWADSLFAGKPVEIPVVAATNEFVESVKEAVAEIVLSPRDIKSAKNIISSPDMSPSEKAEMLLATTGVGKNVAAGLGIGMADIGLITHQQALLVIKTFEDALDMHSPSKVFENIGEMIVAGLEIGTSSGMVKYASKSAQTLLDTFKDVIGMHSPPTEFIAIGEASVQGVGIGLDNPTYWQKIGAAFEKRLAGLKKDLEIEATISGIMTVPTTTTAMPPNRGQGFDSSHLGYGNPPATFWDNIGTKLSSMGTQATTTFGGSELAGLLPALSGFTDALIPTIAALGSVNSLLNPLTTIFGAMMETLGPIITDVLAPLNGILRVVGVLLGNVLGGAVRMLTPLIELVGKGFIWLYNNVLRHVGNGIIILFNSISWVLAHFMNGISWVIKFITFGLVDLGKVSIPDILGGLMGEIDYDTLKTEGSGSTYTGGGTGSSTSVQSININVHQYFDGPVIGEGGMEAIGAFMIDAIRAYAGVGGNVTIVGAV